MDIIASHLDEVRIPTSDSRVYKNECAFSFDTPKSEGGLYVSLNSFLGFNKEFALRDSLKSNHHLYVHLKEVPVPKPSPEEATVSSPPKKRPTLLAIGVEEGFAGEAAEPEYELHVSIAVAPTLELISLPAKGLPEKVQIAVDGILAAESIEKKDTLSSWSAQDDVKPSKYANELLQLDNGLKIPPSGWKCALCELDNNLWLNLTDGQICCGRRNFDGTGGNGHALEHYKATGYPLAVKLGTITPDGADVFSYAADENDMVEDPLLEKHLAHWGIDVAEQKKTERTMMELELDLQFSYDWSRIQEEGEDLVSCYGPGCTGMVNLGNSCYMNSVMQVLFNTKPFLDRYFHGKEEIFDVSPSDPTSDFHTQMAKLADGLHSGRYSIAQSSPEEDYCGGVRPLMLKTLIGRGHREFSTARQQDAFEYFQHVLEMVERRERAYPGAKHTPPSHAFTFNVEERIQCGESGKVRYTTRSDNVLSLSIPLDKATNAAQVEEYKAKQPKEDSKESTEDVVRPIVPISACLEDFSLGETIPDYYSTQVKRRTHASKTTRLSTFPPYLALHMRRFVIGEGWIPKKMDVFLDVPDALHLEHLRGHGLADGEEELPEEDSGGPPSVDESVVAQLMEMGFGENRCRRAVAATGNAGADAAMSWLFERMDDASLDLPMEKDTSGKHSEESLMMLTSMGFTREQATRALDATAGDLERAADWIFSHASELDDPSHSGAGDADGCEDGPSDGPANYELFGFISHIGASTQTGHYVCHLKQGDRWVMFNDRRVAVSKKPPREMAYMYFYRRLDE